MRLRASGPVGEDVVAVGAHADPVQHAAQVGLQIGFAVDLQPRLEFRVHGRNAYQIAGEADEEIRLASQFGGDGFYRVSAHDSLSLS